MIALRHPAMEARPTIPSPGERKPPLPLRAAGLADAAPFPAAFTCRVRIAHA